MEFAYLFAVAGHVAELVSRMVVRSYVGVQYLLLASVGNPVLLQSRFVVDFDEACLPVNILREDPMVLLLV